MITSTDQLDRIVNLSKYAERIISVVPSITELLYDLGLNNEVVGITKFCVHPDLWFKTKQKIGGTKNLNIDKIKSLQPDLIIANKEENTADDIDQLEKEFPVWVSDIADLPDAYYMINEISKLAGKNENGIHLTNKIKKEFSKLPVKKENRKSCAYFIWNNPLMAAGGDTFINEMILQAGFINLFENEKRYPLTTKERLSELNPGLILLSSEPYPFSEKHKKEFTDLLIHSKVVLVDGEIFSWYGSRLLHAPEYFFQLNEALGHD